MHLFTDLLLNLSGALPDQTCPERPYPDHTSPPGGQTLHLETQVESLASNVTTLHTRMLEQSHMYNQLQSIFISLKQSDNGQSVNQSNMGDKSMDMNATSEYLHNLSNSVEMMKQQISSIRDTVMSIDANVTDLRNTVTQISVDVSILQAKTESFQTFMDNTRPIIETIQNELNKMRLLGVNCYKKGKVASAFLSFVNIVLFLNTHFT